MKPPVYMLACGKWLRKISPVHSPLSLKTGFRLSTAEARYATRFTDRDEATAWATRINADSRNGRHEVVEENPGYDWDSAICLPCQHEKHELCTGAVSHLPDRLAPNGCECDCKEEKHEKYRSADSERT